MSVAGPFLVSGGTGGTGGLVAVTEVRMPRGRPSRGR